MNSSVEPDHRRPRRDAGILRLFELGLDLADPCDVTAPPGTHVPDQAQAPSSRARDNRSLPDRGR